MTFRRKYSMHVTLEETHANLLSSTKGVVKEESTKEDSIVPINEGSQSIISTLK